MAGGVYGYYLAFIDPIGMFDILLSVQILLSMLLGGRGTLWGPVLGAFLIEPLNEFANNHLGGGNARLLIFGGLMALVVVFLPQGILPTVRELWERRRARGKAGLVGARLELRERAWRPAAPTAATRPDRARRCSRSRASRSASAACARSTAARSPSRRARSRR